MSSRIVLPLTTAMLAYQAVIVLAFIVPLGMGPYSITHGVMNTLLFGAMVAALWWRPRIGRWPVAALFAKKVGVYTAGVLSFEVGSATMAVNAAMAALCAGLIYALFRKELSLSARAVGLSPRA